jgi:hypothetical protein
MRDWEPLCAGGEAGFTAPDPLNPDIVYGGTVEKCNVQTGKIDRISPEVDLPTPPRHTWTLPVVFSQRIRTRCISAISICSRPRTAAVTGRGSAMT